MFTLVPGVRLALVVVLAGGCASQPPPSPLGPGFVVGVLNGLVAPVAFIGSLFDPDIRIYAFPNSGVWYDLGFLLGLALWGGGAATTGRGGADNTNDEVNRLRGKVRRLRRRLRGY